MKSQNKLVLWHFSVFGMNYLQVFVRIWQTSLLDHVMKQSHALI